MGRSITASAVAAAVQSFSYNAVEAVAKGDLLVYDFAKAGVRKLRDDALLTKIDGNNSSAAVTIKTPTSLGTVGANSSYSAVAGGAPMARLSNGNIVTAYSGDGATPTTNVNFRIFSPLGETVVGQTIIQTGASMVCPTVIVLPTGFAVFYSGGSAAIIRMSVYNNDGTVVSAPVSIVTDSVSSSASFYWRVALLSNGNIAVAYDQVTSRNLLFKIFNIAGVQQGSTLTIATNENAQLFGVKQAANGDIVLVWHRGNATAQVKVARYTVAGAQVGTIQAFGGQATEFGGQGSQAKHNFIITDDGTVFVMHSNLATAANPELSKIDAGNTTRTSLYIGTTTNASGYPMIAADGNNVLFFWVNSGTATQTAIFPSTQSTTISLTSVTHAAVAAHTYSNTSNYGLYRAFKCGGYGYALVLCGADGTTEYSTILYLSADFTTSVVTTESTEIGMAMDAIKDENHVITVMRATAGLGTQNSPKIHSSAQNRAPIIGVAEFGAEIGAKVNVLTQGDFQLAAQITNAGNTKKRTIDNSTGLAIANKALFYADRVSLAGFKTTLAATDLTV